MPSRSAAAALSAAICATVVVVPAQAARAGTCATVRKDQDQWHYVMPYVDTGGFGRLARATFDADNLHLVGRIGYINSVRGPSGVSEDVLTVHSWKWWYNVIVAEDDGRVYNTQGFASFNTPYGPTVWATQFKGAGCADKRGRWGTWNLITNRFSPSSGWMPVAEG